jgi:four helix bundle protein
VDATAETTTPEALKSRLERFAVGVLALTAPMLRDLESRDIALQLRRSASGAFSNYGSACVARSHADFTSKIGIAFEEADESRRWLRFMKHAGLVDAAAVEPLLSESLELRAILAASHLTAKRNRDRRR